LLFEPFFKYSKIISTEKLKPSETISTAKLESFETISTAMMDYTKNGKQGTVTIQLSGYNLPMRTKTTTLTIKESSKW